MNIFATDENPIIAARNLCDKHINKMIVESAQMLANGFSLERLAQDDVPRNQKGEPRTHGYPKHPCTLWAAKSAANWTWLIDHGLAMADEYTQRYGRTHKSEAVIKWCRNLPIKFPAAQLTPFAQAMPAQYKNECPVTAYRAYYHGEKAAIATWKSEVPQWWTTA